MRRREFIAGVGASAVSGSRGAVGQEPALVGYLSIVSGALPDQLAAAFRQGLSDGGFIDGRNVAMEYRSANGQIDKLPSLAEDLVRRGVNNRRNGR